MENAESPYGLNWVEWNHGVGPNANRSPATTAPVIVAARGSVAPVRRAPSTATSAATAAPTIAASRFRRNAIGQANGRSPRKRPISVSSSDPGGFEMLSVRARRA